jgi:2-iminobutanoate/2-iminopropanoate deaminase
VKQIIATVDAPPAIGPYAQGVKVGDMVFVSGQLPVDPKSGRLVTGSIAAQTERVLMNIRAIIEEAEASMEDIVKITIYLKDLSNFDEVNRVYQLFFPYSDDPNSLSQSLPPARATVEVSRLPKDADIEMDAIAVISHGYVDSELY